MNTEGGDSNRRVRILILSGANIDLLGERDPKIYGNASLEECVESARSEAYRLGFEVDHFQSNSEGDLIDAIHKARGSCEAIVINAGALSHTSWAIHDALACFDGVVIELHLSNPAAREPFRHTSVIAGVADGSIAGFGRSGYAIAILGINELMKETERSEVGRG
ncbi:MAG: 3-dehydroquinate dehydratase [Actinobacteria bacterium]|nr:3-dehydroquinate dehydratase [Actinomycetota bacterium]MCL5444795.1 3-dehydroquinate dehydratase [Actinomycetota bacterium]